MDKNDFIVQGMTCGIMTSYEKLNRKNIPQMCGSGHKNVA